MKTKDWIAAHRSLAERSIGGDRKPSLSQWLDLVGDLKRDDRDAIHGRLNPTTAGGRNWMHEDARAVLEKLKAVHQQRAVYARIFVRWLRADMRKEAR